MKNKSALLAELQRGKKFKYLYFWGHQESSTQVGKACLSQWYPSEFKLVGRVYPTAEHFMMAGKAKLFGDQQAEEKVFTSKDPGFAKQVGREVKGFNPDTWLQHRFDLVVQGNLLKFEQNPQLREFLKSTGKRVLVEASPVDKIWGVGLAADDERIEQPIKWRGENLLGFALMVVRDQLT